MRPVDSRRFVMKPATFNIEIDQGTLWRRTVCAYSGRSSDAPPWDMTGCQIHAQIRERAVGPLVRDITVVPTDLAKGTFELVIDDRNRALRKFQLAWDLLIITPDGAVNKYLEGSLTVRPTITRTNGQ